MVRSRKGWRQFARKVEGLGFSTLSVSDHFNEQLAPVPALAAAAEATNTLRVGTLVLSNDYKHPVVLARNWPRSICCPTDGWSGAWGPLVPTGYTDLRCPVRSSCVR